MALKRTASDILAEQHWKRRILSLEATNNSQPEPVSVVSDPQYMDYNNATNTGESLVVTDIDVYAVQAAQGCTSSSGTDEGIVLPSTTGNVMTDNDADQERVQFKQSYMTNHDNQQVILAPHLEGSENEKTMHPLDPDTNQLHSSQNLVAIQDGEVFVIARDQPLSLPPEQLEVYVQQEQTDTSGVPQEQNEIHMSPEQMEVPSVTCDGNQETYCEGGNTVSQPEQVHDNMMVVTGGAVSQMQMSEDQVEVHMPSAVQAGTDVTEQTYTHHAQDNQNPAEAFPSYQTQHLVYSDGGECPANSAVAGDGCPAVKEEAIETVESYHLAIDNRDAVQERETQETESTVGNGEDSHQLNAENGGTPHLSEWQSSCEGVNVEAPVQEQNNNSHPHRVVNSLEPIPILNGSEISRTNIQQTGYQSFGISPAASSFQPGEPCGSEHYGQSVSGVYSPTNQTPATFAPSLPHQVPYHAMFGQVQPTPQSGNFNQTSGHSVNSAPFYMAQQQQPATQGQIQPEANTVNAGYPQCSGPQYMPHNSIMNYQPAMAQGQPAIPQHCSGALYGQPQTACAPLHPMQNQLRPGVAQPTQYPSLPVPQLNPSSDQNGYRKNEATCSPMQKTCQASHFPEVFDSCVTSLFAPGGYMQSSPGGFQRQFPDTICHQNDVAGTQETKENFYPMNQNAQPHNGNFQSRQALTPVNLQPQYWSTPRHGTPICSTKPYGQPRQYRPAPYTFPGCACSNSPVGMHPCRSCHGGHMNPGTRHPRSFNSSHTEYTSRGGRKTRPGRPRRSSSCFHIGQQTGLDGSINSDDQQNSPVNRKRRIPRSRRQRMGDFSSEAARFHNDNFLSNSWHSISHSSDFSSDSDTPMSISRAQPGLEGTGDVSVAMAVQMKENSLSNPSNPILRSLPAPGLNRTKFLVSTYIDYLVEENERTTDISKAFTPPTYLYLEEEQYVLQAHKNDAPFPSNRFSRWIKEYFPQVDAISVPEGKSKQDSTNINRLNLAEKSFDEFAHIVFFGCQDLQEKDKAAPAPAQMIPPASDEISCPKPDPDHTCNPVPVPYDDPYPAPVSDPIPVPNDDPYPAPVSAPIPVPNDGLYHAPVSAPIPVPNDDPYPAPVSAPIPVPNDDPHSAPVGAPIPVPNDGLYHAPVSAPIPVPNDDLHPAPVSAPIPVPNGDPYPADVSAPIPAPNDGLYHALVSAPIPVPNGDPYPADVSAPIPAPNGDPVPAAVNSPIPAPIDDPVPAQIYAPALPPVPSFYSDSVPAPVVVPAPAPNDGYPAAPMYAPMGLPAPAFVVAPVSPPNDAPVPPPTCMYANFSGPVPAPVSTSTDAPVGVPVCDPAPICASPAPISAPAPSQMLATAVGGN